LSEIWGLLNVTERSSALKAQIDKLKRMHFGRKSEQLGREIEKLEAQLEDVASGQGAADVRGALARATSSGARPKDALPKEALPAHLPREERVLEPEPIYPKCGSAETEALGSDVSQEHMSGLRSHHAAAERAI
jgi:transposase